MCPQGGHHSPKPRKKAYVYKDVQGKKKDDDLKIQLREWVLTPPKTAFPMHTLCAEQALPQAARGRNDALVGPTVVNLMTHLRGDTRLCGWALHREGPAQGPNALGPQAPGPYGLSAFG